jgi:hypothetical protein
LKPTTIIDIVKRLFISVLILSPLFIYTGIQYVKILNSPIEKGPWVTWFNDPRTEITISWETTSQGVGKVEYGVSANSLTQFELGENGSIHHINLTGLIPNTQYYYKVFVGSNEFGSGTFKTAPNDDQTPFSWVMISDTQQLINTLPGHHGMLAKKIPTDGHSFIAIPGDIVNDGEEKFLFNDFFSKAKPYLANLPLIPVMGNHDWYGKNDSLFYSYFPHNQGTTANNFFYYSFNYSMVHFTIAQYTYGRDEEMIPEQLDWIEQNLKNAQSLPYRIMLFHSPVRSSAFFGRNSNLQTHLLPLLYKYNVTAIISGHEHHYERGYLEDTEKEHSEGTRFMYMVLGGGGSQADFAVRPLENAEYITSGPCYTEVFASIDELIFVTRTPAGTLLDRSVIVNPKNGGL